MFALCGKEKTRDDGEENGKERMLREMDHVAIYRQLERR